MANEEQLEILKQGVERWNEWRRENGEAKIDLSEADLSGAQLKGADLSGAILTRANFNGADFSERHSHKINFDSDTTLPLGTFHTIQVANLLGANLSQANLSSVNFTRAILSGANLGQATLRYVNLTETILSGSHFEEAKIRGAIFASTDLSEAIGLEAVSHSGPSTIGTNTLILSKGEIPEVFLRGCGLPDWEIEGVKLHNPSLSNAQVNEILYRIFELRATQALQISPLFISYNHGDSEFVDKIGKRMDEKGIRYWRDIHDMKAGRIEKQIDRAIRQNPTVLLVLSEHSLSSDWVEHEVRTARGLEKEMSRDVLCPVALDDSWKSSRWPKRLMEQVTEYNILDFAAWQDDDKFDGMLRRLIDGLELFYKG